MPAQIQETLPIRGGEFVNDVHAQLNPTAIDTRVSPEKVSDIIKAVKGAGNRGQKIAIAGGRHAMGGQQFATAGTLIDMSKMNKNIHLDAERGIVEVDAGVFWPDLINHLRETQRGRQLQWTIAQKQTGCDRLSIGGALAANVHGRGLSMGPIVSDVEEFTIVMQDGEAVRCSRRENADLFSLAIGGYGLFGVTASASLRLIPRTVLQRTVEIADATDVVDILEQRRDAGATYGDFQFAIDDRSPDFLLTGILSSYIPVESADPEQAVMMNNRKLLSLDQWKELLYLAHVDKTSAFNKYSHHYLGTNGQLYLSDTFQLATYMENYHKEIDKRLPPTNRCGTELISELYVPRHALPTFLRKAADILRSEKANVIYGTVRLIEQDDETFLPWAKESWACIVFNLHVDHTPYDIERAGNAFRMLIQLAIELNGSYYLTYHRFATREQLLRCYPQMPRFLQRKTDFDPQHIFASDWFEHNKRLLGHF
jgi:FAD/FMN-containing dehydrogenase